VRLDDTASFRTLTLTPTNAAGGTIGWTDESGSARGSGASITLDAALMTALGAGEHVLTASVVDPQSGRYGQTRVRLLVAAVGDNADHDGDGLSYDQEKTAGLNPGNADSDGDGLSDGAEAALGKNPLLADNDADAALPRRGALVHELGTNRGLIVGDDGLSVTFNEELNPACVAHVAPFDDPVYSNSSFGDTVRCTKRAIRANVGIAPGEFRYFETQRLGALGNFGHGVITPDAQLDPYCCYVDPTETGYPYNGTPPSLSVNSVGGTFRRLQQVDAGFASPFNLDQTQYYGFAVDYTGAEPKVHVVMKDEFGAMTVSQGVVDLGFGTDVPVMPMLYGAEDAPTVPSSRMNLGLQRFHYNLADIKAALEDQGVDTTQFKPGVGAHRWLP
jgi:Bacterial TSP3 repeat